MKKCGKLFLLLLLVIVASACNTETLGKETKELELKIGLMPAVDAAPILLAKEKGYFDELGLQLEATIYTNANNRQSALQTGELDGTMTDLIAFINNHHNGFKTKIVNSTDGSFAFLINNHFNENGQKKVGLMEVSVANYLTDYYIAPMYDIEKVFIPDIPTRLEMINNGKLDIAFIPEPVASMGQLNGLEKLVTLTDDDGYMPEAMVFREDAINKKSEAIALFIEGYNRAVEDIKADESLARDILIKEIELNSEINQLIDLPEYKKARVPSESYLNKVIDWVEDVQGIEVDFKYNDMVDNRFTQS
ncbi:MetQ/NlpA family ABC transporter substrate-binding protein [Aquibacillus koreensis]|uniref:MetQ/NlpA family ABC transporter substrate-binding protein n=1 Tax=Aquibacillus koreensis TaxID=279446 RepID=A0A9X3WIQ8_9BACI|nr:ABC transporter substrate-binding protein [Aquibacillus koreensis]MCT2535041.1 MetQ/NlpA family ABC transporter substrate-binding protein [Aquibacillus koreensis]MDC3419328.1 MetQ/NlpA family ABC transporter substrate-binding protein [Aquibacillus koreensis]